VSVGAVIDASVAIKLVIEEEFSDRAAALVANNSGDALVGPLHLASEVTNAIYQQLRRADNSLTEHEAHAALEQFLAYGIQLLTPPELYPRALAFARAHGLRAVYDSLYVILAEAVGMEMWTDDRRLLATVGPAAPWVRWIGEYPAD
jgi:predicted nucleic acid-binding protein